MSRTGVHFLLTLFLAGCNFAPRASLPKVDLPANFKTSGPWRVAAPNDHAPRGHWWRLFGDSRLNDLMARAEASSPTLQAAIHRVDEARALARADRAGLFPFLGLNGSARRNQSSGALQNSFAGGRATTRFRATLDLDYEIDFWGKLRGRAAAGTAAVGGAEADFRQALLTLQSELAMNYHALRAQDSEIALLKQAIDLRAKARELAAARFRQGDAAQLDVAQAETEWNAARSEAIGLEKKRAELEHAIALLLGDTPSGLSLAANPLADEPPSITASVPSDLLERRPDIAAAERRMAEENALLGVARAALFPSVKIGMSGGSESSLIEKLGSTASRIWGIGPEIHLPIFDGGKLRAEAEAQRARYLQASDAYRATVLRAMREAEDALSGLDVLRRQSAVQSQTVASAQQTVDLAEKRYASGLVAYFEVLDAQRTLLRAQQEATRIQAEQFLSAVLLVKALGGGW